MSRYFVLPFLTIAIISAAQLAWAEAGGRGPNAPETTETTTPDPNPNPSGRNELGGVGPILPYGNDGLPATSSPVTSASSVLAKTKASGSAAASAKARAKTKPAAANAVARPQYIQPLAPNSNPYPLTRKPAQSRRK